MDNQTIANWHIQISEFVSKLQVRVYKGLGGTGKTTHVIKILRRAGINSLEEVLYIVFNKKNRLKMIEQNPDLFSRTNCHTFHSLIFYLVKEYFMLPERFKEIDIDEELNHEDYKELIKQFDKLSDEQISRIFPWIYNN